MALEIKLLSLIDIDIESSFLRARTQHGSTDEIPTFGFLILGGEEPILVDTGASHAEIMDRLGMTGYVTEEMELENQLAQLRPDAERHPVDPAHPPAHRPAGQDNRFPISTTVVSTGASSSSRSSGLMGEQYPAEYIKHLVDRLHTPGALRLLDLELSGPEEIIPGVRCEAGGRTHRRLDERARRDGRGHGVHLRRCHLRHPEPDRGADVPDPRARAATDRQPCDDEARGEGEQ